MARTRLGVPAIAHDECLTGFTTFGATVFPTALAWAATFDPELVERMTRAIGESMHAVGVHQGLSPVLDVVRDYRWGRVEETLGEDPYLVGVIGTAYVRGLESRGVVATLKHFVGYSASQAARNHAPVAIGPRALRDVLLPPFEMAVREGGARSVMNSYSDIDGLPVAADADLLTGVLRDEWGFEGVVVSDYWAIAFVRDHAPGRRVARRGGRAGPAGGHRRRAPAHQELRRGAGRPGAGRHGAGGARRSRGAARPASEGRARAARRRLVARIAGPGRGHARHRPAGTPRARPRARRGVRRPARERRHAPARRRRAHDRAGRALRRRPARVPRLLLVPQPRRHGGPSGARARHRGPDAPGRPAGRAARRHDRAAKRAARSRSPTGRGWRRRRTSARSADVCIAVVGDRPGLFGRGTSGEGCDVEDLSLPGIQDELLDALLETGTPLVLVVVSGRPYALGRYAGRRPPPSRRSSPARRAGPRSPASCPAASRRRGSCPSRYRAAPARSRARTCIRCSAATAAA